jgi:glucan 1,3-beta-glucosidase
MNKFALGLLLASITAAKTAGPPITGTNIGGWMVLEPWITPSLFYRFLGKTHSEGVGMDSYTLCEALGAEEGNKVMRAHWDNWVTEEHIAGLAQREIEMVRLPIGDWTHRPYGPYKGCMDGARDKIQWFLDTAAKYKIKVLLDVHAMKGSQNGFDNSGLANRTEWKDENNFEHWSHAFGEWMGVWDNTKGSYVSINHQNIQWGVDNVNLLLKDWGNHPTVYAIEPLNEPWWSTPKDELKNFYRQVRENMRTHSPHLKFVFHDSFHSDADYWNDMFPDNDMANVVMDTHFYQAWWGRDKPTKPAALANYCQGYTDSNTHLKDIKYDVWVGEWSLATDVCAMWLGGFNDNNTPYQYDCQWVDCPKPYIPAPLGVDIPDRTAPMYGPYGSNKLSVVKAGKCPIDSAYFND